jgi:hypothetical protein
MTDEPCTPFDELEFAVGADPKLTAEGWVRRYLADPIRAKEAIELYSNLGYEVRAEKLTPSDFGSCCDGCRSFACEAYVMIYTRTLPGK